MTAGRPTIHVHSAARRCVSCWVLYGAAIAFASVLAGCGDGSDFVVGQLPKCDSKAAHIAMIQSFKDQGIKVLEIREEYVTTERGNDNPRGCHAEVSTSHGVLNNHYVIKWAKDSDKRQFLVESIFTRAY